MHSSIDDYHPGSQLMNSSSIATDEKEHFLFQDGILLLLLLGASGLALDNIMIFRLYDFAITVPHLLLILATVLVILAKRRYDRRLVLTFLVMLLLEVYHSLVAGFWYEAEWHRSFAQFILYGTCFVLLAGIQLDLKTLQRNVSWTIALSFLMAGIGIIQFILLQQGINAYWPAAWSPSAFDPIAASFRYGGVLSALGLATEPSYYAIGLVTLLGYLLFLDNCGLVSNARQFMWAVLALLGGISVSLSITGYLVACVVVLGWLISRRKSRFVPILISMIAVMIGVSTEVLQPVLGRFQQILLGSDNSTQVRIIASLKLMFTRPVDFEFFSFGTGLGMEARDITTYGQIYTENSLRGDWWDQFKVHNILAVVRFLQGWVGLIAFCIMLWIILRPGAGKNKEFLPMLLLLILLLFAFGIYLSPIFWTLLAFLAVIRTAQLNSEMSADAIRT